MRKPRCGPGRPGSRFFRRFAWLAAAVLTLSVSGAIAGVMTGAVVTAVALALAGMMRRVGMPLGAVMEAADQVAAGDYSVRVVEHGPPSIRALARAFNTMTGRLQNHDRLRRDLMADVAHELRTPLTVMQGRLEGLLDGVYPRDDRQLGELLEETRVLSRLIEDLRTLSLSESGALKLQKELTDLAGLARDAVEAFAGEATARNVRLEVDAPADLAPLAIDPVRVREVLMNLLTNALRHTPPGGSVGVRMTAAPGDGISVVVRDTGSGMTSEEIERAFDRFHKGPDSPGSGLGLTIARSLVAAHGGEIHASSEPGRGTAMTFTLPRDPPQ